MEVEISIGISRKLKELSEKTMYDKSNMEQLKKFGIKKWIAVDDLVKLNKDKGTSAVLKWLLEEVRKSPNNLTPKENSEDDK